MKEVVDHAAGLYHEHHYMKVAISQALDYFNIRDLEQRKEIRREVGSKLGRRGATVRRRKAAKKKKIWKQSSLAFGPQ